ncbi:MAG TPA: hypothetical protein VLM36_10810 [Sphingomicrobium sp.]|nr:hypothetical protein [Sphingomicrobium sp.]
MADQRDDQTNDNQADGSISEQESQKSAFGQHQNGAERDGTSGQPIGGNDSAAGTGTPLSQGADPGSESATGQANIRPSSADTLTADENAGTDSTGSEGGSGERSAGSEGQGFIGSQGSGSDDYLQDQEGGSSSGDTASTYSHTTGGTDFAAEGQGALDEDENESDSGSTGDGSQGGGSF